MIDEIIAREPGRLLNRSVLLHLMRELRTRAERVIRYVVVDAARTEFHQDTFTMLQRSQAVRCLAPVRYSLLRRSLKLCQEVPPSIWGAARASWWYC